MIPLRTKRRFFTLLAVVLFVSVVGRCSKGFSQPQAKHYHVVSVCENNHCNTVSVASIAITSEFIHVRISGDTTRKKNLSIVNYFEYRGKKYYKIKGGFFIVGEHVAMLEQGRDLTKYTLKK
jgi:hypothetical protein